MKTSKAHEFGLNTREKVEGREYFEIARKRYHTTRGATLKVQTTEVASRKDEEFMLFFFTKFVLGR